MEILSILNEYFYTHQFKKTATILSCVSKLAKSIVVPRKYPNFKFNTSDLNVMKMIIHAKSDTLDFYTSERVRKHLKKFKYCQDEPWSWSESHWKLLLTFVIYRFNYYEKWLNAEFLFYFTFEQSTIKSLSEKESIEAIYNSIEIDLTDYRKLAHIYYLNLLE